MLLHVNSLGEHVGRGAAHTQTYIFSGASIPMGQGDMSPNIYEGRGHPW